MSDDKKDLTRIEDLSEFIHKEDPSVDALFDKEDDTPDVELPSIDDLDDEDEFPEMPYSQDEDTLEDQEEEEDDFSLDSGVETEVDFQMPEMPNSDEDESEDFNENTSSDFSFDAQEDNQDEEDLFSLPESEEYSNEEDQEESDYGPEEEVESDEDNSQENEETTNYESEEIENYEDNLQTNTEEVENHEDDLQNVAEEDSSTYSENTLSPKENFSDVRKFAENITYGEVVSGGNPPFSIILNNIKYQEDAEDILIILKEHGICNSENEQVFLQGMENGSLLISQISEYSAIYITHKLRRFDVDIKFGLSDEIHVSKSYEKNEHIGLISKSNLRQNKAESAIVSDAPTQVEDILLSTTPTLENYSIVKYIDIATSSILVSEDDLNSSHVEDENLISNNHIYQDLADNLKNEAIKLSGNAVVGINYQLTPVASEDQEGLQYQLSCSGNIVWIMDQYKR